MTEGVSYPTATNGNVSTTATGKNLLASSVAASDPSLAQSVLDEKNWRDTYPLHCVNVLRNHIRSKSHALAGAYAGLEYAYENFSYVSNGEKIPLNQVGVSPFPVFNTKRVVGEKPKKLTNAVSIAVDGKRLTGEKAGDTIKTWYAAGLMEASAKENVEWVLKHEEDVLNRLEDTVFVVFGAGSALGPFSNLVKIGATVAAVDLPIAKVYERLSAIVQSSPGSMLVPEREGVLGCNLLQNVPEVARWLVDLEPGKRLVLGNYAYADGANFVRVVLAMDCICQLVRQARPNVAVSYLCSPTDCFMVPDDARDDSHRRYHQLSFSKLVRPVVNTASNDRFLSPNYGLSKDAMANPAMIDNFIMQQGPNYAIAKRLQHWRALLLQEEGVNVSSNIAPASSTESVTKNVLLKAAYGGTKFFSPIRIFTPESANSTMTVMLLHDIFNENRFSRAALDTHPHELFISGAVHGGMWRNPYRVRSVSEISAMLYFAEIYGIRLLLVSAGGYLTVRKLSKM